MVHNIRCDEDIYYQCYWCKRLCRDLDKYLEHKKLEHFEEFQNTTVPVFIETFAYMEDEYQDDDESRIKEASVTSPCKNRPLWPSKIITGSNEANIKAAGSSSDSKELVPVPARHLLSSSTLSVKNGTPSSSTPSGNNGQLNSEDIENLKPVVTSDGKEECITSTSPRRRKSSGYECSLYRNFNALPPKQLQLQSNAITLDENWTQEESHLTFDSDSNESVLSIHSDASSPPCNLDPIRLLRMEWAESETQNATANGAYNPEVQVRLHYNFIPHYLEELCNYEPLTLTKIVHPLIPSKHSSPCVRLKRLTLNELEIISEYKRVVHLEETFRRKSQRTHVEKWHLSHRNGGHFCVECNKYVDDIFSYATDTGSVQKRKLPFKCRFCPRDFKTKRYLQDHMKTHMNKEQVESFVCQVCGRIFGNETAYIQHGKTHSKGTPLKCSYCGARIKYGCSFREHRAKCNAQAQAQAKSLRSRTCRMCKSVCKSMSQLFNHVKKCNLLSQFKDRYCAICNKLFNNSQYWAYHMSQHSWQRLKNPNEIEDAIS